MPKSAVLYAMLSEVVFWCKSMTAEAKPEVRANFMADAMMEVNLAQY